MAYSDEGKVENYLTIDIDNSFSSQIATWADAVDLYIDKFVGKTFADEGEITKNYDGNGRREIDIDNFMSLTSVEILEITGTDTDFTLTEGRANDFITFPYNETPKFRLILTPTASIGSWSKGKNRIKITGRFGETSVPKDIELAATMLLAGIVEKGLKGGTIASEDLGDYSVTYKEIDMISSVMGVKEILSKYKIYKL